MGVQALCVGLSGNRHSEHMFLTVARQDRGAGRTFPQKDDESHEQIVRELMKTRIDCPFRLSLTDFSHHGSKAFSWRYRDLSDHFILSSQLLIKSTQRATRRVFSLNHRFRV